jgi:hypothetical protein
MQVLLSRICYHVILRNQSKFLSATILLDCIGLKHDFRLLPVAAECPMDFARKSALCRSPYLICCRHNVTWHDRYECNHAQQRCASPLGRPWKVHTRPAVGHELLHPHGLPTCQEAALDSAARVNPIVAQEHGCLFEASQLNKMHWDFGSRLSNNTALRFCFGGWIFDMS